MAPAGGGGGRSPVDFASLAAALLDRAETLVPQWLPGGRRDGHEWAAARSSKGGPGDSLKVNLVTGRWAHFAGDESGGDLISLWAYLHGMDQADAARELMAQFGLARPAREPARADERTEPPDSVDSRPEPPADDQHTGTRKRRVSVWRPIVPVPANAPAPTFGHWARKPEDLVAKWEYRFEGELYGWVTRFRTSDGGKETLPHTWCVDESDGRGTRRWHWKQWDEPRPLYVPATLLSGDLSLPVVLVEGEKCALAGHQLLGHEFDFVSWPGGAKAWAKAHWGWLKGRVVFLWPDADSQRMPLSNAERERGVDPATKPFRPQAKQPGMAAMLGIGSLLVAEHGCTVYLCALPEPGEAMVGRAAGPAPLPDGWDIADAIAEGWDAQRVRDFIRRALAFVAPDDSVRAKAGAPTPTTAGAGRTGEGAAGDGDPLDWYAHLMRSATTGAVKTVRENVVIAVDGWPEKGVPGIVDCSGLVRFNEFSNNIEKVRATPWGTPAGDWLEADELQMGDWLVREHRLPSMSRQALEEAVIVVARRHRYHPVRRRIEALRGEHDGHARLDLWLRRVFLEEDEFDDGDPLQKYLTRAGRWFVMGMCARVMSERRGVRNRVLVGPGCKFDYMLVLEGPTGWGKSSVAAMLGGEHFADTGLDVTQKDALMNIQGVHIYEWGELEQMARQELGALKRFISSSVDRFRATFDRRPAKYPRQVVFVGTTEESSYLMDPKGNRRFWPVRLTRPPDTEWLEENLEQLLAEAVMRVDAGERFWPDRDEQRDLFDPQQSLRTVESSLESAIRHRLYDEDQKPAFNERNYALVNEVSMTELLSACGFAIDKQTDPVVKRAGSVMHALGWEIRRTSLPGRPRVYVRPDRAHQPASGGSAPISPAPRSDDHPRSSNNGGIDDCPF